MNRPITGAFVGVAAAATVGALALTPAGAAGASAHTAHPAGAFSVGASQAPAVPGTQLWVKRYNGPGNGTDSAYSVALTRAGGTAVVTGESAGSGSGQDFATVAYNTATGAQRWASRYNGPGNGPDTGSMVAVSPDGTKTFATGTSAGTTSGNDFATIAYNTATGAQLWVKRYNGPANGNDGADEVAVSPNGRKVFVTGPSRGATSGDDYVTVAYNAATGAQLWARRYNGPGNGDDWAFSMAVSPAGNTVFVTGASTGRTSDFDYATVGYNAATGAQRWVKRYNGPANSVDVGWSTGVTPNGRTVFVTGQSEGAGTDADYATVAYNAATGDRLWARRYSHYNGGYEAGLALAVSPNGKSVFVTGPSFGGTSPGGYATIAYTTATGARQWAKRYNAGGTAFAVAVNPAGSKVYVTGGTGAQAAENYGTVSYNAATGAQLWVKVYNGPANGQDNASSVAVSPSGGKVFVTGSSTEATSGKDYTTIAYSG